MFTENDLKELLEFKAPGQMVTLYLNTEPSKGNADAYRLRMRSLLKDLKSPQDVIVIERFFNQEYNWAGRSVAVFSCAEANFFRAYPLAIAVRDLVIFNDKPGLKPLTNLLDNYGGYGVALVDHQGARLFFFHMGELREQEGVIGEEVKHAKRGGASAVPGRRGGTAGQTRYVEQTIENNMKEVADFAVDFFEKNHVRRILIGGTDDNVALFRTVLPKSWQSLVKGTFPIGMTTSHAEVLTRAMQIGTESEMQRESQLVDTLITASAKGANAVIGLEKTAQAVNDGRVQTLVLAEEFHHAGFRCTECDMLVLEPQHCDNCGGAVPVPDIVEQIVHRVMHQGGAIEIVRTSPRLEQAGQIGAFLRY